MQKPRKKYVDISKLRDSNFLHTQQRARQRYNLILSRSNYEQLCHEIKQKKFESLSYTYKDRYQNVYKIKFKNTILYVIYIDIGNRITTALPFQRFERLMNDS